MHYDTGPEPRAILAHAPPFHLIASGGPRRRQRMRGYPRRPVLLGVEAREMLAEDLRRRVALDPFRAGIPARHAALRVEHVDRVVGHPVHQQAEAGLAL